MPLYNKAPYVRKAVESIVEQSFMDWELWVVDDGSTDGGGDIVSSFSDNRIHLIRQENAGVGAARNRGAALATAPMLCFLDADDWWEPTFLKEMAGVIERNPDAGIYGTSYYIVKNGKKRIAPIGVDEGFTEGEINYCQVYAKTLCMPLTSITVCMPHTVFEEFGGFPTGIKLGEDFLLWVHVVLKYKVVLLNKPLSNYNQDVDITYRGTHHLHNPKEHMLWNLGDLESLEKTNSDYKQLIDNLRTYSLMAYLLEPQYSNAARKELSKVDWKQQPRKTQRQYQRPIWILAIVAYAKEKGSRIKNIFSKISFN